MPTRSPHPCSAPGCGVLTQSRFCPPHTTQHAKAADSQRLTSRQRGYDSRWDKARKTYIAHYPLCAMCEERGRLTPATVVDHIIPHKGDQGLFWDTDNWQALCAHCHSSTKQRMEKRHG